MQKKSRQYGLSRTKVVQIRLNAQERKMAERGAKRESRSLSEYVRELIRRADAAARRAKR